MPGHEPQLPLHGRIKPHRFGEHALDVIQSRHVLKRWQLRAKHRVDFSVHLRFDFWILRQQVPFPCLKLSSRAEARGPFRKFQSFATSTSSMYSGLLSRKVRWGPSLNVAMSGYSRAIWSRNLSGSRLIGRS